MVIFKCKMCGGDLQIIDGKTTTQCEYCGCTQTIVSSSDEKKITLFNRANALRMKNEFDKAMATYETIIMEYPNEVEAHWGVLLCRYGVEYVDDPRTHTKIPTCNRTQYKFIFDDEDYKFVINNSDVIAKELYVKEANKINKIQRGILEISQKEDPFDIFICYKETDINHKRTIDSVIAQDIYNELTNKGYKVFFSRVTLESKLGTMYEPYIFAALNSSKVMIVIGSKPEYFNAVWVKNEWSRFLELMNKDSKKYMIPCYKNLDAYDIPEEMLGFQSQDLNKIGYMQDLTRGIDKLIGRDLIRTKVEKKETVIHSDVNINGLLTRAQMLIEDGEFKKADGVLERILDNDPKNAFAYLYKLLIETGTRNINDLIKQGLEITNYSNYQKALKFASGEDKKIVEKIYEDIISNREIAKKEKLYNEACQHRKYARYDAAIQILEQILNYKDSNEMLEDIKTERFESIYLGAVSKMKSSLYEHAIIQFKKIIDYKDSKELIAKCENLIVWSKNKIIYESGKEYLNLNSNKIALNNFDNVIYEEIIDNYKNAIKQFERIPGFLDTQELILKCKENIEKYTQEYENYKIAEENKRKKKKAAILRGTKIGVLISLIIAAILTAIFTFFLPLANYNKALNYIENKKFDEAENLLYDLGDYFNASDQLEAINAIVCFDNGDYEKGIDYIYNIGGTINVSYDGKGGTIGKNQEIIKKSNKYISNYCEKDGYIFYGWKLDSYEMSENNYCVDLKLVASYETIYYSISTNLNGGKLEEGNIPLTYSVEDEISIPNCKKTGYTFLGWSGTYLNENTIDLKIEKGSKGNKSFAANWKANKYTITFDYGYDNIKQEQKVTYDSSFSVLSPKREGYEFLGWKFSGASTYIKNGTYTYSKDITLVGEWKLKEYSISYKLNGGANNLLNVKSFTMEESVVIYQPTRTGYTFTGWNIDNSSELNKSYTIPTGTCMNVSLTANWEANEYKISFDSNGGCEISDLTVVYNQNFELPLCSKMGYDFKGWLINGTVLNEGKWNYAKDIMLTAYWEPKEYVITLQDIKVVDLVAIYSEKQFHDIKIKYNSSIQLPRAEREGYIFVGWQYNNENFIAGNYNYAFDITLCPVWRNTYTIYYDSMGGSIDFSTQNGKIGENFCLLTPTKKGYEFLGWYMDDELIVDGIYNYKFDLHLTANWKPKDYAVTYKNVKKGVIVRFNDNYSNSVLDSVEIENGNILTYPTIPDREGYLFTGWYLNSSCTNRFNFNEEITTDLVLYAGWYKLSSFLLSSTFTYPNGVTYFSEVISGWEKNIYVVANFAGEHSISYRNSMAGSSNAIFIEIENISSGEQIMYSTENWSTVNKTCTFNCEPGDIIHINFDIRSYNNTIHLTFEGFEKTNSTSIIKTENKIYSDSEIVVDYVTFDSSYNLIVPNRENYLFEGWYLNNKRVQNGIWKIDEDVELIAKWTPIT